MCGEKGHLDGLRSIKHSVGTMSKRHLQVYKAKREQRINEPTQSIQELISGEIREITIVFRELTKR